MRARTFFGLLGLVFSAGAGLSGCGEDPVPIACTGAQPCPPPSARLSFAAQLFPRSPAAQAPGSPLTVQEEPNLVFNGTGSAALHFIRPARVSGIIRDETAAPVAHARVLALLHSVLPGQGLFSFETSTGTDGSYSLNLPAPKKPQDQPYRIWIGFDDGTPGATLHPPLWFQQVISADTTLPVLLPRQVQLVLVHGPITQPTLAGGGHGGEGRDRTARKRP